MAETLTANYGWTKPEPGGSPNTWGSTLNSDLDAIDAQVYANQQAGVPVGSGALWFTSTPPTNWLLCQGQSLATTGTYAALFAVIGYTYGGSGANFNLPNPQGAFPFGAGGSGGVALGSIGGAASTVLQTAQLPVHAHTITDVAHNHTINDPTHVHPDPGHGHGATASQDPHAHGGVVTGFTPFGGVLQGAAGGVNEILGSTDTQQPAVHVSIAGAYTGALATGTGVSLNPSGTGLSVTNPVGSANPVPTMPPFLGVNFIIKYQ